MLRPISISSRRRFCVAAVLALALAPGTWVRASAPGLSGYDIDNVAINVAIERRKIAGFTREEVWQLTSTHSGFGGISALIAIPDTHSFRAFSDRGMVMRFPMPGHDGAVQIAQLGDRGWLETTLPDIESATGDPVSGDYWLGFESGNAVIRFAADDARRSQRRPPEWQEWANNSGPEAMARLADGRFIVLAERGREGLLYAGDPSRPGQAMRFTFTLPGHFAPTDLTALPDGRVLVLMRRVSFTLPPFSAALGIFDPADITATETLQIRQVLLLDDLIPPENYEGLAVAQDADGALSIWIISDDNFASFQRTLLAKLTWTPDTR